MSQRTIEVGTARGTMPVHVHEPEEAGPHPLVVLFMDAPGVRPALHGYAERVARAGYVAALPDLYYWIDPADLPDVEGLRAGNPQEFARMGAVVARMHDDPVLEDARLMLGALPGGASKWACVGFCMGGRFALRAAETFGDDLAAAGMLHPSRIVTDDPDSPHLGVGAVTAQLYFGFGENDHVTPVSMIPPLREELDRHRVPYSLDVIPGADHGFTMPGMPAYNREAAERAWTGTLELLGVSRA